MSSGGDQTAYDVFVALHVAAGVIGFGSVALSGVYGGNARHPQREESMEELRRYFASPGRLELLIALVPVFGVVALAVEPGPSHFGQVWVAVGGVLWVLATVLLLGVVRPAEGVLRRQVEEGSTTPVATVVGTAGLRLQWASAASDLIFLVALVVMVIKPGS